MSDAAKIGTYVLYGKTGVCLIKEKTTMPGVEGQYYVLSPISDSRSSVYVPCDNPELVARMRPLLTREEIERLLSSAEAVQLEWIEDRNDRASYFRSVVSGGDRTELIRLIGCLMRKRRERAAVGKRLSTMDENFLQECVRLVQEEFSMVLSIEPKDVSAYIHERL